MAHRQEKRNILFVGTITNQFGRESRDMVEAATVLKNGLNNDITVNMRERIKKERRIIGQDSKERRGCVDRFGRSVPNSPTAILL